MTIYAKGTKLEYLHDHDNFKAGEQVTVTEANSGSGDILMVRHADGRQNSAFPHRFKPVPAFKVGDTVTCIKYEYHSGKPVGETGVIAEWTGTYFRVQIEGHGTWLLMPDEIEHTKKEESKVTELLKVGDRVTVKGYSTDPYSPWEGRTGTITKLGPLGGAATVDFSADGKGYTKGGFNLKYLVLAEAEKTFGFSDIQKGDNIRRTRTHKSGATEVTEGVAEYKGSYYWDTEEGVSLAFNGDTDDDQVTIELLERPEPPKSKVTENRVAGDQIILWAKENGKINRIFTKLGNGNWSTVNIHTDGSGGVGFVRTNDGVEAFLSEDNHKLVASK